jgi:hypothetical protein
MIDINWNPSVRELRQFAGIWFPGFFIIVGGLTWYKTGSLQAAAIIWTAAFLVSLVGYVVPAFMRYVFVGLTLAAFPIGWTVSHLILFKVYFLVLTPIGLIVRRTKGDPMQRSFDRTAKTYWIPHNPAGKPGRYFKQF